MNLLEEKINLIQTDKIVAGVYAYTGSFKRIKISTYFTNVNKKQFIRKM